MAIAIAMHSLDTQIMKIRIINILVFLLLAATGAARDVASFCDGWEFKKGPFPADAMKGA